MKQIFLALAITLTPFAASAQDEESGLSLMERGARDFMDGVMKEMGPALRELKGFGDNAAPALRNFAQEMGPKLAEILDQVEDWSVYEPPEVLANGDILIRRKPDAPVDEPDAPEENETLPEPAPPIDL